MDENQNAEQNTNQSVNMSSDQNVNVNQSTDNASGVNAGQGTGNTAGQNTNTGSNGWSWTERNSGPQFEQLYGYPYNPQYGSQGNAQYGPQGNAQYGPQYGPQGNAQYGPQFGQQGNTQYGSQYGPQYGPQGNAQNDAYNPQGGNWKSGIRHFGRNHEQSAKVVGSVIHGAITGGVAALVFLLIGSLAMPSILRNAYSKLPAATENGSHVENGGDNGGNSGNTENPQLPDFGEQNEGNSGNNDSQQSSDPEASLRDQLDQMNEDDPFLGITTVDAADVDGYPDEGAVIASVLSGGSAEDAGLQAGDLIVAVGDTDISSVDELKEAISKLEVGEKTRFTIKRQFNGSFVESKYDITMKSVGDVKAELDNEDNSDTSSSSSDGNI
ncbi:MAG: PDZ domain-containing protein [Eubacterium sp.]|nr:PDZ domain-containing protein [Eubacterium sp.]